MAQVKRRDIVNLTGGVKTEDGRLLYGMDAEVYIKVRPWTFFSQFIPVLIRALLPWVP